MGDPQDSSEMTAGKWPVSTEPWLGGEAFLGNDVQAAPAPRVARRWSPGEVFVLFLSGLTLGTAMGLFFGRTRR